MNPLIVTFRSSRILAVKNDEYSLVRVEIAPFDSCNSVWPHHGCDHKFNNAAYRNDLSIVGLKY